MRQDKSSGGANLRCEEEDEQTHKDDQDVACCFGVFGHGADYSNHELTDGHTDSSPNEQRAATELLNGIERDRRRAHVDDRCDHGDQERVLQADCLEERGVVV
jgi:hypothetical protein